jgi:hypothetical protein
MQSTVDVNEATAQQLSALLSLAPDEAAAVVAARPFAAAADLWRRLPERVARTQPGLALPKLDINQASADDLVRLAGTPDAVARAVQANRPYYVMLELRHLPGVNAEVFNRLMAIYASPDYSYVDKLSGQIVQLDANTAQVLVRLRDDQRESAHTLAGTLHLQARGGRGAASGYQVFTIPESETGTGVLAELKRSPSVEQVVPAFQDADGEVRYVDPAFCVVQFQPGVAEERQAAILGALGLEIAERHRTPGLVTVQIPSSNTDPGALYRVLASLNGAAEVQFAEPGYVALNDLERTDDGASGGDGQRTPDAETATLAWNLALIHAQEAWRSGTGSSDVVIAVIDTGVDEQHAALQGALLPREDGDDWNFADDGESAPVDEEGHGTFIAGLLVGNGALGVHGLCPGCRVLPLKAPVSGSALSYARRRDAILYALDRIPEGKRLVINLSWKTSGDVALIRDAVAMAVARGAVVVCSAGNWPERADQPHYPSDYPSVLSVGGVGPDGRRADYSFFGSRVDVAAPGGSGAEDPQQNLSSAAPGGGVQTDFGTSFAAPHVAGLAALVLSQDPTLTPPQVGERVTSAAVPVPDAGLGRGLIDAAAALAAVSCPVPGPAAATVTGDGLATVNQDDLETLILRFGLARLTARLLLARRPFARLDDIRGILGLTDEQFARIAGTALAPGDTEAARSPSGQAGVGMCAPPTAA